MTGEPSRIAQLHHRASLQFADCVCQYVNRLEYGLDVDELETLIVDQYNMLLQGAYAIAANSYPNLREQIIGLFKVERIMATEVTTIIDPFGNVTIQQIGRQVSYNGCSSCSCTSCTGCSTDDEEPADTDFTFSPVYNTNALAGTTYIEAWQLEYSGSYTINAYPQTLFEFDLTDGTDVTPTQYSHVGGGKYILTIGSFTTVTDTQTFTLTMGPIGFSNCVDKTTLSITGTAIEQTDLCVLMANTNFTTSSTLLAPEAGQTDSRLTRIFIGGADDGTYVTTIDTYPANVNITDILGNVWVMYHSTGGYYYPAIADGAAYVGVDTGTNSGTWSIDFTGFEFSVVRSADSVESTACATVLTLDLTV